MGGGAPRAELDWVEPLLDATENLQVATGIVNIWTAAAGPVAESFHRIEAAHPGRFLLGIGVGHPEAHPAYRKPVQALTEYLDQRDEYGVPRDRRVVAALGPKVLKLSADRAAGRKALDVYLNLANYLNNWKRLGFGDEDGAKRVVIGWWTPSWPTAPSTPSRPG